MLVRILVLALVMLSIACGGGSNANNDRGPITVSAAVSLKDAFNEIGAIYRERTGREVTFNFGSSGALQKQIETGAPADVFASAGAVQMDALLQLGSVDAGTRKDFAHNRLVVIVPRDGREVASLTDLTKPEFKRIAAGNPKTVPAGQYADQAFVKASAADQLRPKLVYGEDVRQVLDYVVRGEVDAGLVYATDASVAGDKIRVALAIPDDLHEPIAYPIAAIKDSKHPVAAKQFIDLVLSPDGQAILAKYGFTTGK